MLLSDVCLTSDVCLSLTLGVTREAERPGKTKIGTEIAHVSPLSRSKGQRSRSPGRFTQRGLNAQGGCSGQRGNVFGVGKYCYVASARRRARAPTGWVRGAGHIVSPRAQLVLGATCRSSRTGAVQRRHR